MLKSIRSQQRQKLISVLQFARLLNPGSTRFPCRYDGMPDVNMILIILATRPNTNILYANVDISDIVHYTDYKEYMSVLIRQIFQYNVLLDMINGTIMTYLKLEHETQCHGEFGIQFRILAAANMYRPLVNAAIRETHNSLTSDKIPNNM